MKQVHSEGEYKDCIQMRLVCEPNGCIWNGSPETGGVLTIECETGDLICFVQFDVYRSKQNFVFYTVLENDVIKLEFDTNEVEEMMHGISRRR